MIKSIIYSMSGRNTAYATDIKTPYETPPPHSLKSEDVVLVIHDWERELTSSKDDHETFHARAHECEYKGGKLLRKGKPLKAQCVEKLRMRNGILEDNTVHGWKARAIFEPEVDDNGEEIEGPDGEPEGKWYYMGPWGGKTEPVDPDDPESEEHPIPNLIETPAPDPEDRRVWKGTQGNEIEPEQGVIPDKGSAEPEMGTT